MDSSFSRPRSALGFHELLSVVNCIFYYRRRGLDPGYDGYFEDLYTSSFSSFLGGGYADAVSSGCASIYIALKSLNLPRGSLVATSPVTDASVIGCIDAVSCTPYLIDSDPNSYNTSLDQLTRRVHNKNVSAFIITHAGGQPCSRMNDIKSYCDSKKIFLVEDCSQCIGGTPFDSTSKVGTYGEYGCFSTMYRKNLSASGSSGLIFSKNFESFKLAKQHADRGKRWWDKDSVDMRDPGFADFAGLNFNSDELRCAIGLANLRRLNSTNSKRLSFLKHLSNYMFELGVSFLKLSPIHDGLAPFYFPIQVLSSECHLTSVDVGNRLKSFGLPLGTNYGCLISTWDWAKRYMHDDFVSINAINYRDSVFHLYLNENYTKRHAYNIASLFLKVQRSLSYL